MLWSLSVFALSTGHTINTKSESLHTYYSLLYINLFHIKLFSGELLKQKCHRLLTVMLIVTSKIVALLI